MFRLPVNTRAYFYCELHVSVDSINKPKYTLNDNSIKAKCTNSLGGSNYPTQYEMTVPRKKMMR